MKRKIASIILSLAILLGGFSSVEVFAQTYDEAAEEAVLVCKTIGVLLGTGSGLTEEYLNSTPLRYQGAVMLLRLKALLSDAMSYSFSSNYTDYMDLEWAPQGRNMLGYIKAHEDVGFSGYPDGSFLPTKPMDAKQYYKLMLETLGYEYGIDYTWNTEGSLLGTMEFAQSIGLTWLQGNNNFTIRDLAIATTEALKSNMKIGGETLTEKLIDDGIIMSGDAQYVGLIFQAPTIIPTATLSIGNATETSIITGEAVMTVNITNATFKSTVGNNNNDTTLLLSGFNGSLSTPESWNACVSLNSSNVTRLSDTSILIKLNETPEYRIGIDETLTLTIDQSLFNEEVSNVVTASANIRNVGAGTIDSPWEIYTIADFNFIKTNLVKDYHYILMNDLDFSNVEDIQIDLFKGVLDGNNHELSHITIEKEDWYTGLFKILDGAVIRDLSISNSNVKGLSDDHMYAGIVAGASFNTTFSNVKLNANYTYGYERVGGLVGYAKETTLMDCEDLSSRVFGVHDAIGGLIGHAIDSTINSCNVTEANIQGNNKIGGIIGYIRDTTTLNNCEFSGLVNSSTQAGGIVGYINENGTVTYSKSYGHIISVHTIGGIVGEILNSGTIENSYCGITAFDTYLYYDTVRRIVGTGNGMTLNNNTGSAVTKYNAAHNEEHEWISDPSGNDGETVLMFMPILPEIEFELP